METGHAAKLPGELTAELPEGDDFPVGNVNFAEAEAFCQKLTELGRRLRRAAHRIGSFGCPPKRSGSTPAGPERRPPPRSASGSAANRRISRGNRTTGPSRGRRSIVPPKSAVTRPTPGGCTTCTATSLSGAGIGITARLPGGYGPRFVFREGTRRPKANTATYPGSAAAGAGPTRLALPDRLSIAVRAGAALRPHRLSRRGREAVIGET